MRLCHFKVSWVEGIILQQYKYVTCGHFDNGSSPPWLNNFIIQPGSMKRKKKTFFIVLFISHFCSVLIHSPCWRSISLPSLCVYPLGWHKNSINLLRLKESTLKSGSSLRKIKKPVIHLPVSVSIFSFIPYTPSLIFSRLGQQTEYEKKNNSLRKWHGAYTFLIVEWIWI